VAPKLKSPVTPMTQAVYRPRRRLYRHAIHCGYMDVRRGAKWTENVYVGWEEVLAGQHGAIIALASDASGYSRWRATVGGVLKLREEHAQNPEPTCASGRRGGGHFCLRRVCIWKPQRRCYGSRRGGRAANVKGRRDGEQPGFSTGNLSKRPSGAGCERWNSILFIGHRRGVDAPRRH